MGRRGRKEAVYQSMGEPAAARESLERRWYERVVLTPELATQVTAGGAAREPFHRWLHFKHGFSPELVRLFLREPDGMRGHKSTSPVLDPFSGSGTVVTECARRGVVAIGAEALASLGFLTTQRFATAFPDLPKVGTFERWADVADTFVEPVHRAALMLAVARQHTSDGRAIPNCRPLHELFSEVVEIMREDLRQPLPGVGRVESCDARDLATFDDESVGGVLTSPPYLSRHDYQAVTRPYDEVYRHWYAQVGDSENNARQVAAHPKAKVVRNRSDFPSPEIDETCEALKWHGQPRLATVVRHYFDDLFRVLREICRVLQQNAPCWVVIGGARMKDVCVPSDLILAEFAMDNGFLLHDIRVARDLIDVGRKLGRLKRVTPRESILVMTKA